jgi:hypothetical protein
MILSPNPPDYEAILELDDGIRAFSVQLPSLDNPDLPLATQHFLREHHPDLGTLSQASLFYLMLKCSDAVLSSYVSPQRLLQASIGR